MLCPNQPLVDSITSDGTVLRHDVFSVEQLSSTVPEAGTNFTSDKRLGQSFYNIDKRLGQSFYNDVGKADHPEAVWEYRVAESRQKEDRKQVTRARRIVAAKLKREQTASQ